MNRRTVCASLGAVIFAGTSGCIASNFDGDETDGAPDSGAQSAMPETARRKVEVAGADEIPDDIPVTASVEVSDPWITEQATAVLEHRTTNTGSETRALTPRYVQGASSWESDPGIVVYGHSGVQNSENPGEIASQRCWEDDEPTEDAPGFPAADPPTFELAPDETGSIDLIVADDPSVTGCFPPGQYRFERELTSDETSYTWGFSLSVSDVTDEE